VRAGINNIESIPSAAVRGLQACATRRDDGGYTPGGTPGVPATVSTQEFNVAWYFHRSRFIPLKAEQGLPARFGSTARRLRYLPIEWSDTVGENSGGVCASITASITNIRYSPGYFRDQGNCCIRKASRTHRNVIDNPQNGALSLQSNLTNTMINEAKVGFNEALSRDQWIRAPD